MSFNTLIAVRVSLHLVKAVLELHCGEFRWWTPWLRTKAGRATSSVRSGALPLTLIQYRYISISLQLYIHTSIVHLGMQGFLPRLCAQRYAADKSVLDRINATLLLCALGSVSDCQRPPETPSRQLAWAPNAIGFVLLERERCSYTSQR